MLGDRKEGKQPFQAIHGRAGLLHAAVPTASAFLKPFSYQIIPFPSASTHVEQEPFPGGSCPSFQLSKKCGFLILCSVHLGRIWVLRNFVWFLSLWEMDGPDCPTETDPCQSHGMPSQKSKAPCGLE